MEAREDQTSGRASAKAMRRVPHVTPHAGRFAALSALALAGCGARSCREAGSRPVASTVVLSPEPPASAASRAPSLSVPSPSASSAAPRAVPTETECPAEYRVRVDPAAWPKRLGAVRDDNERTRVLAELRLRPVGYDGTNDTCRSTPKLTDARASFVALADARDWVVSARYTVCGLRDEEEAQSYAVAVLHPTEAAGEYCVVGSFERTQSFSEGPCLGPPDEDRTPPALVVDVVNLTDIKHKTLRVRTNAGHCAFYPRDSDYELEYYDLFGYELRLVFGLTTFSESHSVMPGPSTVARVAQAGGFPRELMVETTEDCGISAEGVSLCDPKVTKERWRFDGRKYQKSP